MSKELKLHRPNVGGITPYEPGKPISEVQREYGLTDVIKLASNENPLGPSPLGMKAASEALADLNRYPDGGCYYLKQKLADMLQVDRPRIVVGNGSAELVELITEAFVGEGDEAIIGKQAFFKYRIAVQIMDGSIVWAEMPNLTYDADELLAVLSDKTKVIFIANPNNPTGTLMNSDQVDYLMSKLPENIIVVFDEAYWDYRDPTLYPDTMKYLNDSRNVIILRTFSKSYGLAGLRVGYALAPEHIAHSMNAVREAFNVNSIGQAAATAALDDKDYLAEGIRLNEVGKSYYYSTLDEIGLEYIRTDANFLLVKAGISGRELFQMLLKRGVVIRPVDGYGLPEYIRVSIGLPSENERFISELKFVLKEQGKLG